MNIDFLVDRIRLTVDNHKLSQEGTYARYRRIENGKVYLSAFNEYGCADAANIRYTIGEMPIKEERQACINVLQHFQDVETGMFKEESHVMLHGTAHCIAALELFDEKPIYPMKGLDAYRSVSASKDGVV